MVLQYDLTTKVKAYAHMDTNFIKHNQHRQYLVAHLDRPYSTLAFGIV